MIFCVESIKKKKRNQKLLEILLKYSKGTKSNAHDYESINDYWLVQCEGNNLWAYEEFQKSEHGCNPAPWKWYQKHNKF